MAFGFLGAFRQTQWFNLRRFLLNERRAVDPRIAVIDAEIERIGLIRVIYQEKEEIIRNDQGFAQVVRSVTENRLGMDVTEGSTLLKLCQAYIANGGNPMEISLFLQPDSVGFDSDVDPDEDPDDDPGVVTTAREVEGVLNNQPHFGIVSEERSSRGPGGQDAGGFITWGRFAWKRIGRSVDVAEASVKIAGKVDHARRWANQAIQERLNNIEARIIKQMDLREQLILERDSLLMQSVGGSVEALQYADPNRFHDKLHVTVLVSEMDRVFYGRNDEGALDFNVVNITGLANYDTLWLDLPDDDPFTAL